VILARTGNSPGDLRHVQEEEQELLPQLAGNVGQQELEELGRKVQRGAAGWGSDLPGHWHASAITTAADLAPFTSEDLDEARSRLTRLAQV